MSKVTYGKEGNNIDTNLGIASFYDDERCVASGNVRYNACELCKTVGLSPSLNNMSRLLRVNVRLVNVCYGKEVTVGCIITDTSGRVVAYKSETFIAVREGALRSAQSDDLVVYDSGCGCSGSCGDVNRVFNIILPDSDVCAPLTLCAKIMANYTSPCA